MSKMNNISYFDAKAAEEKRRIDHNILCESVDEMIEALDEQERVIRRFHDQTHSLALEIESLDMTARRYQSSLNKIQVDPLTKKARRLAKIMGKYQDDTSEQCFSESNAA